MKRTADDSDARYGSLGRKGWRAYADYWLLALLWAGMILLVGPGGDFPLNDDWAYAQNVRTFLETGQLRFNDWLAMTLVVQVLWGAAWCAVFGFSYVVLRWSTLFLAGVAVLAVYQLLREETGRRDVAWLGALLLALDPWFVSLSFTFMTDIPFLAFFILSLLFYFRALRSDQLWAVVWGTLFALLATGVRQYGLLAPLGFGLVFFIKKRSRRALPAALLPLLFTYAALWAFTRWMETAYGLPDAWGRPGLLWERLRGVNLPAAVYERGGVMLWYWGLMLRPLLLVGMVTGAVLRQSRRLWWGLGVAILAVALLAVSAWGELPWGNVFYNFGLGPLTLKDGYFGWNPGPALPGWLWTLLLLAGFVGAILLLARLVQVAPRLWRKENAARGMAAVMLLIYASYLTIDYYMWDRYLLVAVPLWLVLLAPGGEERLPVRNWWRAGAALLLLGAFAVTATHDYLSWNRARWEALRDLEARGVPAARIDGGFEYNAALRTGPRRILSRHGKSWWYVADDAYAVTFGPLLCYEAEAYYPFRRWLPPGRDSIWVLKRPAFEQVDTFRSGAEQVTADSLSLSGGGLDFGNADRRDTTRARSGRYALKLDTGHPYGFTLRIPEVGPCDRVAVSVWRYAEGKGGALVFSAPDGADFYEATDFASETDARGWERIQHEITLPADFGAGALVVYVWHTDEELGWYDDVVVEVRRVNSE